MKFASAFANLLPICAIFLCVEAAGGRTNQTCYDTAGDVKDSDDVLGELERCLDSEVCCYASQDCLPNKLCSDRETKSISREYCTDPYWADWSGGCSQLCNPLEKVEYGMEGRTQNLGLKLVKCPDGGYCCDVGADETTECCREHKGFLFDEYGNRQDLDADATSSASSASSKSSASSTSGVSRDPSTSSTSTDTASSDASTSSPADQDSSDAPASTGLSTGAKAGIGAGVGLLAVLACVGFALFYRERKKKKANSATWPVDGTAKQPDAAQGLMWGRESPKAELPGQGHEPARVELDGQPTAYEMSQQTRAH